MPSTYRAAPDIDVITSTIPVGGLGHLAVNAFLLHGPEPLLVDTGTVVEREEFLATLNTLIDPAELRWIWLTHTDFDHIGAVGDLVATNPHLRVITTFLGAGIMGNFSPLPMDRVNLVNPGQTIAIGDRTLTAFRPPAFDNPITTGFHDDRTGALFSSDCFGALLDDVPERASELDETELRDGQIFWATIDSPWLHGVDTDAFARDLDRIRQFEPTMLLSSHLPAAPATMVDTLLDSLAQVPGAQPFVSPDQAMLDQMLADMAAGTAG